MNSYQRVWWEQAKSDYETFDLLRKEGAAECHMLHYLQMATEKLAKAYFWRSATAPPRSHAGFVQFMRFLGQLRPAHQDRIANLFTFRSFTSFQSWLNAALPIAYELQGLAPNLAGNGPNTEYPWPHSEPTISPCNFSFPVWEKLFSTGQGRRMILTIGIAVDHFDKYAEA